MFFPTFQKVERCLKFILDLVNADGNKIKSTSFQCFNQEGTVKRTNIQENRLLYPKEDMYSSGSGMDIPASAKGIYKGKAFT